MTRRTASAVVVVALVLLLPRPGAADGKWTRLQTENFLFIGDAPESQLRDVAQHLEQFRDVMSRALPPAAVVSPVPTIVFVFQADGSFAPYTPRFEGRPVDVAGFFQPSESVNYVAINAGAGQSALRIVFHEYAHFLARNTAGELPVWANEGLAGVYETFEERGGGKGAVIGVPHPEYLSLLQHSTLIPLRDLLSIDHTSPVYNEGDRRGLLYAESWALMHYLMLGSQARAPQLQDFFRRVKSGEPGDEAFLTAFGSDVEALERELREYLRTFSFPLLRLDFTGTVTGSGAGRGDRIDESEARAYLGDLLARMGRLDDARAQLRTLVAANAQSARAISALALLEFRAENLEEALPLLERAASLDAANVEVQRAWGRALFARSQEQSVGDDRATDILEQARVVLNRAAELSPRDPETLEVLAPVEVTVGARFIPELRRVGSGETRVLGLFSLVECRPGSVVVRIDTESHAFRLETDNLAAVEFISSRDPASAMIGCGPVQPPVRVLATFREDENAVSANAGDGEVVAIELLPDGYTPP